MAHQEFPFTIGGMGGKGGRQRTPKESPDTLRSRQVARVIDLISEGPCKGLVGGQRGVFIDGVALENKDGTLNFDSFTIDQRLGYPHQTIMSGYPSISQEVSVNTEMIYSNNPIVRSILNTDVDRCRITLSVPTLSQTFPKSGDTKGTKVSFRIEVNNNSGGFKPVGSYTIDGKTTSKYQRAVTFALPRPGPWQIRAIRTTVDSTSQLHQNELWWDSYTEITDDRVNYANSAIVGMLIDSEQFSSIPSRTYLYDGILCRIPVNYDPIARKVTGVWNGKFKTDWTDNPAWVFYDLLTQNRYGLGQYLSAINVDKWQLYTIAQYCDGLVPIAGDPKKNERRYSCNIQITSQSEAFDLLQQMAAVFHGWTYWASNSLRIGADMPSDPVAQFTNANAIDGIFSYSGNDVRSRHTMAAVSWRDPARLGDARISLVQDHDGIARYGIQRAEIDGLAINSEGQALRTGAWVLYAEQYEAEAITFRTSFEGNIAPGSIIRVADASITGKRRGGRVREGSTVSRVNLDGDPGSFTAGSQKYLSCVNTSGTLQMLPVTSIVGGADPHADMATPFASAPLTDSVFVITEGDQYGNTGPLQPTQWRVTNVNQVESNIYEIIGSRHLPSKYAYIEKSRPLVVPDISDISLFPPAVTNLKVTEYMVATSPISVGVRGSMSWTSRAPSFDVVYRSSDGNWTKLRTDNQAIDFPAIEGEFEFSITPVGLTGMKGATASMKYTFIGRFALPDEPKQLRINVVSGVALFDWLPAPEMDVVIGGHYELRHTASLSDVTWGNAAIVIPSIPGSSTHAEIAYQPGTWLLRTFDITGRASKTFAVVKGIADDSNYFGWERKCENPDWIGTHANTVKKMPQEWLTIATLNGGKWDSQTWQKIDSWDLVDELPTLQGAEPGINVGVYTFRGANTLDAGGVFSVRLSLDMLAFPYSDPTDWLDDRIPKCDTWQDWDATDDDLEGQALIMMRTTDNDPASGSAVWTAWKSFVAGEHIARGFQFQVVLTAPYGQNIGLETLCIIGDFRAKFEEGADIPYTAAIKTVTLQLKYFHPPAIVVNVQNDGGATAVSDKVVISNKTTTSFQLSITNAGAQVTRSFDYHASGY